jgi:Domain of unknown function (DUF4184)
MPFTGSHVAAVLPFLRWGLPPSALVIGSMAPDAPYYLPVPVDGGGSHTLPGVVGADLLLGLAVFVVWHSLVGPAVAALAPPAVRRRLTGFAPGLRVAPRYLVAVVVALLLGSLTHVVWDSFTHVHGWVTERVPLLRADLGPLPVYRWAQYLSGIVGGLAIAGWSARRWRRAFVAAEDHGPGPLARGAAAGVVLIAAAVGGLRGLGSGLASDIDPVRAAAFQAATGAARCGAVALVRVAAVWALTSRRPYRLGQ